jgi:hypothetical protein
VLDADPSQKEIVVTILPQADFAYPPHCYSEVDLVDYVRQFLLAGERERAYYRVTSPPLSEFGELFDLYPDGVSVATAAVHLAQDTERFLFPLELAECLNQAVLVGELRLEQRADDLWLVPMAPARGADGEAA